MWWCVQAGLSTRVRQWWEGIPFLTSAVVVACAAIYLICLLAGYDSFEEVCFSPSAVVSRFQGTLWFLSWYWIHQRRDFFFFILYPPFQSWSVGGFINYCFVVYCILWGIWNKIWGKQSNKRIWYIKGKERAGKEETDRNYKQFEMNSLTRSQVYALCNLIPPLHLSTKIYCYSWFCST